MALQSSDGKGPARLKVRRIARFKKKRIKSLTKHIIAPGALVVTDGLACFRGVTDAGYDHHPIVTGASRQGAGHPSFRRMNTVFSKYQDGHRRHLQGGA